MKYTAYVFVNKDGQYYGNRDTARIPKGKFADCWYDFDKAMLFTSEAHAIEYRSNIINTNVSSEMKLMPITSIEFSKAEVFKAVLTGK